MALKLKGSTSGFTAIDAPAVAGDNTLVLPNGNGTAHQVIKNSATAGTLEYGLTLPSGNGSIGQYLQSDGAGGSSWQTVADTNGYTWLTGTAMTGAGTITTTGIDTDATDIIILFEAVRMASTGWMQFRVGNGSEDTGNNYDWSISSHALGQETLTGTSIFRIVHSGNSSSTHVWNGHVRLMRNDADHFIMTALLGTQASSPNIAGGRWYGGTTGIDRVSISTGTGNFNGGRTTVGYIA